MTQQNAPVAKLFFAMNVSLDGYVAGEAGELDSFPPSAELFRHFVNLERSLAAGIYGRRTYEVMRYWDEDRPEWTPAEHEFAAAWRAHPKWIVSTTLTAVGTGATLVSNDVASCVRDIKEKTDGNVALAGPELARSLTGHELIDEYRLYVRPLVLGRGKPYFAGAAPPLRFVAADCISEDAARLILAPASARARVAFV